jgi:hypothetical protein
MDLAQESVLTARFGTSFWGIFLAIGKRQFSYMLEHPFFHLNEKKKGESHFLVSRLTLII